MNGRELKLARKRPVALLRKLTQPLYDTNILEGGAAVPSPLQFFVLPQGTQMPVTAVNKTEADTNMKMASQIGYPQIVNGYPE